MKNYKIYVYAICKNEAQFVDRWMDSMSEADAVIVTDTGSSDETVKRLRRRGAIIYEETISPWRFDTARNLSLSHVPDDADICVCTDLDECFEPGWRKKLEQQWQPGATMGNYLFNWSLREDGTPDTQFTYFKVHTKKDYKWSFPIHECLSYIGPGPEKKVFIDGMILNHYPDHTKSRGSYLPLLELAVKEDPQSDRMTYYLGREYMYTGQWQQCIDTLTRYLDLPTAWWKEERSAAMRWIARSYQELRQTDLCYRWYYRAIAEVPHMRDAYIECARTAYQQEDWVIVFFMTAKALQIKKKSEVYVNMGYSWDHTPDDLAALACYHLGMYAQALDHAEKALAFHPEDKRLQNNVTFISAKITD